MQLLEEIGEKEIKSDTSKAVDFRKPVRILMDQFKDMEKVREKYCWKVVGFFMRIMPAKQVSSHLIQLLLSRR